MTPSHVRRALLAAGLSTAVLAATSTAASAAPVVTVKTSTAYAIVGFPVTVTVKSTEAGTAKLLQVRPDRALGPGRCSGYNTRYVAGTQRTIAAGQTITYSVQPSSLFYGDGQLLPPPGWDDPNNPAVNDLCYDRYSTYNQVRAEVSQGAPTYGYGSAVAALTRLI